MENVPFSDVREVVLPHESALIKYGSKKECKYRHLCGDEDFVGPQISELSEALKDEGVNLIISIASGGFEPAALTADYLGVNQIFPVRYSHLSHYDKKVLVPQYTPDNYSQRQIQGKAVLIIDDIFDTGRTASAITKWAKKHGPTKIYFAFVRKIVGDKNFLSNPDMHQSENYRYLYQEKGKKI